MLQGMHGDSDKLFCVNLLDRVVGQPLEKRHLVNDLNDMLRKSLRVDVKIELMKVYRP